MESNLSPDSLDKRNHLAEERTKLAAERTFLSWLRTGMTSMGIGIALARLIVFKQIEHQRLGQLIGQLLILWGICIFILSLISYYRSARRFTSVSTGPSFVALVMITIILIIISFFLFWIVVD